MTDGTVTAEEDASFQAAVSNLGPSIVKAREAWEFAGRAYATFSAQDDWEDHRAAVELIMYLASLDYEIKLLLHRFHAELENRAVWEKYLGLMLYEGIGAVQKLAGANMLKLRLDDGVSSPKLDNLKKAMARFNADVKVIRGDAQFWMFLTRLRNEVTAHHTGKRASAMTIHASWAIASEVSTAEGYHSNMSMIGQHALRFGRAVQTLGADISRGAA